MNDKFNNSIQFSEMIMETIVKEGQICVDATAGNGFDTLKLANLVGEKGLVYSFDIQVEAIENTEELLINEKLDGRVRLIKDSHAHLKDYIRDEIDFIIYNLGYMPGGDKSITTVAQTTLESVSSALSIMKTGAIMLITIYKGHKEGFEEYESLVDMTKNLEQNKYNVFKLSFENQKNSPPITIGIEVRGENL